MLAQIEILSQQTWLSLAIGFSLCQVSLCVCSTYANIYFIPPTTPPPSRRYFEGQDVYVDTAIACSSSACELVCVFVLWCARFLNPVARRATTTTPIPYRLQCLLWCCFFFKSIWLVLATHVTVDAASMRPWSSNLVCCCHCRPPPSLSRSLISTRNRSRLLSFFIVDCDTTNYLDVLSKSHYIYIRVLIVFVFGGGEWIAPSSHHRTVLTVVNLLECDSRVLRDILCWDRTSHLTFVNKRIVSFLLPASCTSPVHVLYTRWAIITRSFLRHHQRLVLNRLSCWNVLCQQSMCVCVCILSSSSTRATVNLSSH